LFIVVCSIINAHPTVLYAQKAVSTQHSLNGRMLEVKVATPREEMKPPAKKITRVFVARIPPIVTDEMFRSYFEKYGALTDAYMPKAIP
jgi:RNA-binding protein Musashi